MIFDHQFGNITIHANSIVEIAFDFTNDLGTGDTISSDTTTAKDDNGNDVTSTLIMTTSNDNTKVYVTLQNGTGGRTYEVQIEAVTTLGREINRFVTVDVTGVFQLNSNLGDINANSYVSLREANEYVKSNFYHPDQWDNLTFEGRRRVLVQAAKDIDALNYKGRPYYDAQKLAFPRDYHDIWEGTASPLTATAFRGNSLYSGTYNEYPDNYFQYGTVHIKNGKHEGEIRMIASSEASPAGNFAKVNVSSPFTSTVVASDQYLVFRPLYQEIKDAQCEQAMYLIENRMAGYAEYLQAGIGYVRTGDLGISFKDPSKTLPDIVSVKVRKLVGRHLRKGIAVGRA